MIKQLTPLVPFLLCAFQALAATSDFPDRFGKTYDSFTRFNDFYELLKNDINPEGSALVLTPVPYRVMIGDNFIETTNSQVFSVNLIRFSDGNLEYSEVLEGLAVKVDGSTFVERACWIARLKTGGFRKKCFTDRAWNLLTEASTANALEDLLSVTPAADIAELVIAHNHPDKATVSLNIGTGSVPAYFGPSPADLRMLKIYSYKLADRGINLKVTGIVVPYGQSRPSYLYYFRAMDPENPAYISRYVPEALRNGTIIDGAYN